MPQTERRTKPDQNGKTIKRTDSEKEVRELDRLLSSLTTSNSTSNQQLPSIECSNGSSTSRHRMCTDKHTSEAVALHKFSLRYQNERNFSDHKHAKKFQEIFTALTKYKLCCSDWLNSAPQETVLRVLICLRIIMRDSCLQKMFFKLEGVKCLSEYFQRITEMYLTDCVGQYVIDILKEMTNIFQKLSVVVEQREYLVNCRTHVALVQLLSANERLVLHCALHALIGLAQSSEPRYFIGELNSVEFLLRIIQEYDPVSKKLAANLLRLLCQDRASAEKVQEYEGITVLLNQLNSENINLLWHIVWCLAQLCEDSLTSIEIRERGGIPLLLSLLHERKFVSEKGEGVIGVASAGIHGRTPALVDDQDELQYSLKSACCAALTELVLNDTNAQQIAQANGIYALGLLILPQNVPDKEKKGVNNLQRNAFRTLRFLFSMERNRGFFKRLFPAELFEVFIDVGHYNKDLSAYKPLIDMMNTLPKTKVEEIKEKILETNQNRSPSKYIGDYSVFELLGSGAFGSVYKVKKTTAGQSFLALKEVNLKNPAFGKNSLEVENSVGEITNELQIMEEQLKHENVVRYYKTFVEGDKLYIVMDLIDGAPLLEHFSSLKEKKEKFKEKRIWNIFLQMLLALRYLHKEKGIVHRDLTPSNVMLGEQDKVTITDFGLAKQKRSDCSKMTSVVGTILYSCPEIVQHKPYGEKADIWALGCILYQLCTLEPPFYSSNMLSLVTKIVKAVYEPIPEGEYSPRLIQTVSSLIKVHPEERPDILEVSGQVVDLLLINMDKLRTSQSSLQKKLDRERKRTMKNFIKASQSTQKYQELEEQYDFLVKQMSDRLAHGVHNGEVFKTCSSSTEGLSTEGEDNMDRGWTSDDESNPSSSSESRESSAGSIRSRSRATRKVRLPESVQLSDPLSLNIPLSKYSRDSGLSSDDPSPNKTNSPGPEEVLPSPDITALINGRPNLLRSHSSNDTTITPRSRFLSARSRSTATLSMSPSRLREISDPIVQMLVQLHKIIFITQLPPPLKPDNERRKIDQFKRALFSPHSNSINLKSELRKLMQGSRDMIDVLSPNIMTSRPNSAEQEQPGANTFKTEYKDIGISYEQLNNLIEKTLTANNYYKGGNRERERERTPPFSPLARRGERHS